MVRDTVSGIARDDTEATKTLADLRAAGFQEADLLRLLPSRGATPPAVRTGPPEQLARLSPVGASAGGLAGLAIGTGTITVISAGGHVELGWVLACAAATAIGAALGAHVGSELASILQRSRDQRKPRELLVSVYTETPSSADAAKQILESHAVGQIAVAPSAANDGE